MPATWTQEMVDWLTRLCQEPNAGSYTLIALAVSEKFGVLVSKNACLAKASRLGISNGHPQGTHRGETARAAPRARPAAPPRPEVWCGGEPLAVVPAPPPVPPRRAGTLQLTELTSDDCHWPFGNGPYLFCGDPVLGQGYPYCPAHTRMSRGGGSR